MPPPHLLLPPPFISRNVGQDCWHSIRAFSKSAASTLLLPFMLTSQSCALRYLMRSCHISYSIFHNYISFSLAFAQATLPSLGYKPRSHDDNIHEAPLAPKFTVHGSAMLSNVGDAFHRDLSEVAAVPFNPLMIRGLDCLKAPKVHHYDSYYIMTHVV